MSNDAIADFTRIDRINIKDATLDQLKRYILSSGAKAGARLPSERDLAERLGVGRSSVREALKVLEAVGLVEIRYGDGAYVAAQAGARFGHTIGLSLAAWGGTLIEIMDARRMTEVSATRFAAERATDEDIARLKHEVALMESTHEAKPQEYLAADMRFHRLVGQATHNAIIQQITDNLISMLESVLSEMNKLPNYVTNEGEATHRRILEAIEAHAPDKATDLMRIHLKESSDIWQAVVSLGAAQSVQPKTPRIKK
jgi:DNA-binding FadR family transcriptional regulator